MIKLNLNDFVKKLFHEGMGEVEGVPTPAGQGDEQTSGDVRTSPFSPSQPTTAQAAPLNPGDIRISPFASGQPPSQTIQQIPDDIRISPFATDPAYAQSVAPGMNSAGTPQGVAPQMPGANDQNSAISISPALTPSEITQERINNISGKDYSKAVRNEQGEITKPAGKDRDKDWTTGDKIVSTIIGILRGLPGGLINAAASGIEAGTNRNFMEQMGDQRQLSQLIPQLAQQQQAEDFQTGQQQREANIRNTELKPVFEQQKIDLRQKDLENKVLKDQRGFDLQLKKLEQQGQLAKDKWKPFVDEETGMVYKQFLNNPNRQSEPYVIDGKQIVSPSFQVYDYTSTNGTVVKIKGKDIVQGDIAKGNLALAGQRQTEVERSNRVREGLAKQQFDFARQKWTETVALRREAMAAAGEARANNDLESAAKFELEQQKWETQLNNYRVNWKKGIGRGGFTEDDFNELTDEQ